MQSLQVFQRFRIRDFFSGEKIYVGSHNLFNVGAIPDRAGYIVNNGDSLTITQPTSGAVNTITKLKDACPGLRVGDVATLNASTSGIKEAYLSSGNSWVFGTRLTITQNMLDAYLYFYANGEGTTKTISNAKDATIACLGQHQCANAFLTIMYFAVFETLNNSTKAALVE